MREETKKYRTFKQICEICGISEDRMSSMIVDEGKTIEITTRNRETGTSHLLKIIAHVDTDEYIGEFYEVAGSYTRLVLKSRILIKKPKFDRPGRSAVSDILGTIILMAVAVAAGSTFYIITIEHAEVIGSDPFIDVVQFKVTKFDDYSSSIYAELYISTSDTRSVSIGGNVADIILVKDGAAMPDVIVEQTGRGIDITYSGVLDLYETSAGPGQSILVDIIQDEIIVTHRVEVQR